MKTIEISEDTFDAIVRIEPDVAAFVERAARRQIEQLLSKPKEDQASELAERLRRYRGMLRGVTIEDVVASRHQGLS